MPFLWLYRGKCPKVQIHWFLHVGVRTNPNLKAFQNTLSSPLSIHKIRSFWPTRGGRVFWNGKQRIYSTVLKSIPFPLLFRWKSTRWRCQWNSARAWNHRHFLISQQTVWNYDNINKTHKTRTIPDQRTKLWQYREKAQNYDNTSKTDKTMTI